MNSQDIEALAADIGRDVYMDIAKWHLFLAEAHLHTTLAEKIAPLLENRSLSEESVQDILKGILIPIGGGQQEIPLINLMPVQSQVALMDILEEYP